MQTLAPMSWQWEPGGQSLVSLHGTVGMSGPMMQWCAPSVLGLLQPLQVPAQSGLVVQTLAQLPLLRHSWPAAHVVQDTGCPQLLVRTPQRPPQVAFRDSGVQQVPPWQTWLSPQVPHEPPQPSLPQLRSVQFGVHSGVGCGCGTGFFFLRRFFLASALKPPNDAAAIVASPPLSAWLSRRRDVGAASERVNASKRS
jgi:hypothetical protein